jgi:UDP-glucose 4-epimerase
VEYVGRRAGDSHTLVANNDKARAVLGWVPQYDLSQIIRSAWDWHAKSNQH